MIKLVIFDLDGVLIDSRNIHYHALNEALGSIDQKYVIDYDEHLAKYDGLNTTAKLNQLTIEKGLPKELHDTVWKRKQDMTSGMFKRHLKAEPHIHNTLRELKKNGYTLYCASNSIWATIRDALYYTGYIQYFDWFVSNQDILYPKPSSCIYMECMKRANVRVWECLICEDSPIGLTAARGSGAHVCQILNIADLTLSKIKWYISRIDDATGKEGPVVTACIMEHKRKINIVIPMAGHGSRFAAEGYTDPKPLIKVEGKPMIQRVVENMGIHNGDFIFIVQRSHDEKYKLKEFLAELVPDCKLVYVDKVTQGAACSVLLAEEYINNDVPLLIANSDQLVEWGQGSEQADPFIYMSSHDGVDGSISVFRSVDPKFSFASIDEMGWVTNVVEKKVISDIATTGIYYWSKGSDFVRYAQKMIEANKRVNNEFYVAPVYNEAIVDGKKIRVVACEKLHCLGTPEELAKYLAR